MLVLRFYCSTPYALLLRHQVRNINCHRLASSASQRYREYSTGHCLITSMHSSTLGNSRDGGIIGEVTAVAAGCTL